MFNLSSDFLLGRSTPLTVKRGGEYYKDRRIKSIQFNQEKLTFDASVMGTKRYSVQLNFDRDGDLHKAYCSCSENEGHGRFCKHTLAVLLMIKDKDEQGFFNQLQFRKVAKQIFSFFQNRPNVVKSPVDLEVTYELTAGGAGVSGAYSGVSLRIGQGKLYVVRDIKAFFEKMDDNEEIVFGKGFTFDPSRHEFKGEDKPLMSLFREVYETERLIGQLGMGFGRGSVFREKQICLANAPVKRFFELMRGRNFKARIKGELYEEMQILEEDFPVQFLLSRDGQDLVLGIELEGNLLPLTDDGEYFFMGGKIYKTSRRQQENFKPFYLAMMYQKGRKIRFMEEDKEKFVSEVLPFAEKVGPLKIDEKVQPMIEKVELEPEIYLDRSGGSIIANVRFKYGERTINPFGPLEKSNRTGEKILLRDMEKERSILDILGETEFKVRNHEIYLDEEAKIFDFISEIIPQLQEYAAVFYSEDFKSLAIRRMASFTGGIRLNSQTDMLEFTFDMEGIDRAELIHILNSFREKKKYYRLEDGSYLQLEDPQIRQVADMFEYLGLQEEHLGRDNVEIPKYRGIYLDQRLKELGLQSFERNHAFRQFVQSTLEPADTEFVVSSELRKVLREYQKFGFKWLKTLSAYGLGGVLADDMGLGKTLQVIALILSEKEEKGGHPSLVVVPTSLVFNWCAEVEKFAPGLKVLPITGSKEERSRQMEGIGESDLVVTSYPLIRRDIEDYKEFRFRFCILDEAQHIKNPGSQNARTVKEIVAERRFALTGTPMENSLNELWSIFDFILPGYLFSHTRFSEQYEAPIAKGEGEKELQELGRQLRPFILRRLKKDVLKELPEKIEHKMVAELTEEQKKVYAAYLQQVKGELDQEFQENGFERSHIKILAALTRLRQICCHPGLFLEDYEGESGKLQLLQEVVSESVEAGHRILLFSQFTSMLAIIRTWMAEQAIEYLYLDGSTPVEERGRLVKAFNDGKGKVFLISLKAGGTGLNLTGADTVIHYDPWWNPAVEDQATDRAYRIGQNRAVHVIKLITHGTIEEKIFELQQRKKQLIDAVIQPGETLITKLTEHELRSLFE
jgi:SNF2 family DNA or RNA helicase